MNISLPSSGGSDSAFDPLEFYRITAHIIQSPFEAAYRTAIGRAYYAIFLTIANMPSVMRILPAASYGEGSHSDVIHAVRRLHMTNMARRLVELKQWRTLADYTLMPDEEHQDWAANWNTAIRTAEWLINALPSLQNARP